MARGSRSALLGARPAAKDLAVMSGFQGADLDSGSRGYVYFPTLDTRRELDSWSRYELTRRARFLYKNVGMVRRIINGISRMVVGRGIRPRPKTGDQAWNAIALADFNNTAGSAAVFDIGGRYNFYQAQRAFMRGKLRDGNMFSILARTASDLPAMQLFESHQVGNGSNDYTDTYGVQNSSWIDGVLVNKNNRRIAYRVLGDDDKSTVVSATDMIAFCDLESPGQVLGPTVLYHAINHLLDITEMSGYLKLAIKQASMTGYAIEGATRKAGLSASVRKIVVKEGSDLERLQVEKMIRGGKAVELEPGAKMSVLADPRPHPNTLGFWADLRRDIGWGVGIAPEVLWDIEKLGGANTRFILADAQEYVEEQQDELIDTVCKRYWVYQTAVKLNSGLLPPCEDPEWWKCDWMRPRKLTVDYGRDGKLYIELQGRGMLSLERWHAGQGQDWKEETLQFIDERAFIKEQAEERGLSMDDIIGAGIMGQPPLDQSDSVPGKGGGKDKPEDDPDKDPELQPEEQTDPDEEE